MSVQSSMAVAKAKEARHIPALVALLEQGNYEAVAALKELNDKKAYAQGLANETAMSQEDTLSVLEQLVGNLDAPQSGIAAYASGGRAFSDGGAPMFRGDSPFDRAMSSLGDLFQWKGNAPAKPEAPAYPDTTSIREAQQAGSAYPDQVQARSPTTNKATVRKPGYSGIAAAAAPAETSPPSDGAFDPKKRMQRQEGAGMPSLPAAEDQTDDQLRQSLEALTTLQKERDELRGKSRAQLEAAYNAKVKNLTPSKFDRVMEFLAGVSAKGGSSAAQALGAGALAMHGKDKARKEQLASVKEMYDKADLLEQEALVRDRMKDVEGAMALRKQAADLQRQIATQKSTERLQGAQAGLADAQAAFTRDVKPGVEQAKANRASRPTGIAAGAGAKQPNPVQIENAIRQQTALLMKADPFNPMPEAQARAKAEQLVRDSIAKSMGKPAAASPAAPKAYDFGTLMQGQ